LKADLVKIHFIQWRQQNQNINNNDQKLIAVSAMVYLNPLVRLWQIKHELRVPRSTVHRIMRSVNSYHITFVQALNEDDRRLRINFCIWALNVLDQHPDFFWFVCFCDEPTFYSTNSLNRHNSYYWSPITFTGSESEWTSIDRVFIWIV